MDQALIRYLKRPGSHRKPALQLKLWRSFIESAALVRVQTRLHTFVRAAKLNASRPRLALAVAAALSLLLLILAPGIYYLARLAWASAPAWLLAAAAYSALLLWFRVRCLKDLMSPQALSQLAKTEVQGRTIHCRIDEARVMTRTKPGLVLVLGSLAVAVASGLLLGYLYRSGGFQSLAWSYGLAEFAVPSRLSLLVAGLLTLGCGLLTHHSFKLRKRLNATFRERIKAILQPLNASIEATAKTLEALESDILLSASQLKISFPSTSSSEIGEILERYKADALSNPEALKDQLEKTVQRSLHELAQLKKAEELHRAADSFFGEAASDVNRTGLMPLIRELDQHYRRLTSNELKARLQARDWDEYQRAVATVMREMKRLRKLSRSRLEEKGGSAPPSKHLRESDREKALRILRLPPNAGREEVRKAYRWLSTLWHPDRGLSGDDSDMKDINWANEFLTDPLP